MPRLTFSELARMVGGEVVRGGDRVSDSVVIDSREVRPGSVFFAIRGERLDGHQFLPQALQTAEGAVVSQVPDGLPEGKAVVRVEDTTAALQRLSTSIRERFPFVLIGITGSAGKTTTKEMIATLIATEKRTHKSWGNFNNEIGAPLCLDNMPDGTEVVVSEMGMNHKGEIARIAGWTRPDIGVYTTIQPVHLEFFGTIEKIAEAKRELLENLRPGGSIVINIDNEHVVNISRDFEGRAVTYAVHDDSAEFRAINVRERGLLGTHFTLRAEGAERELDLAMPGGHNLENLVAAIATARLVGISWESIERGVADIKPAYHRGVVIPMKGATLYDDTYNSNPYALGRTLDLMAQADVEGRRIAVIGDMLELGPEELKFHREAGAAIPRAIDVVVGVGPRCKALLEGARQAGFAEDALHHFEKAEGAGEFLRSEVRPGDLVLLKGSRGIGLDRAIAMLESNV